MNKITEGSQWKDEIGIEIEVLHVHEEGVMFKYEGDVLDAYSKEDFLEDFTPLPKTHKVFRLYKFLEDKNFTSKDKARALLSDWPLESEGKTKEEMPNYTLNDDWLVEEDDLLE